MRFDDCWHAKTVKWFVSHAAEISNMKTWAHMTDWLIGCALLRSSHWRCSVRKGVLRNFAKFTGKHLCQSLFLNKVAGSGCSFIKKETLSHMFSCEFCEISLNTFFTEHIRTAASDCPQKTTFHFFWVFLTPMHRFYQWETIFVWYFWIVTNTFKIYFWDISETSENKHLFWDMF